MELEFEDGEVRDYVTVPEGTYVCKVVEVRPGETRAGDARWGMRLVVAEGEFVGRQAAWDGLVFSERGRARVQRVLEALELPCRGRVDLSPEDLVGRTVLASVRPVEYRHPDSGQVVRRNEVPYDGYAPVRGNEQAVGPRRGPDSDPPTARTAEPAPSTRSDDAIPF